MSKRSLSGAVVTRSQVRRLRLSGQTNTEPGAVATGSRFNLETCTSCHELPRRIKIPTAINSLAMGHVIRIALRFKDRFWESLKLDKSHDLSQLGFIHNPEAPLPTWWTQLPAHEPLLIGWTGGSNAEHIIDRIPADGGAYDEALLKIALESLHQIFHISDSQLRDQLVAHHTHEWHSDPFSRGAYAYVPVNALAAQEVLSQPVDDVLFFAGEAVSVGHIGTVHGALESGERAAKDILKNREAVQ